jgi:hypothetical protein
MKIRNGFVSNSSSSSFVIPKDKLTFEQIEKIRNHIDEANKHSEYYDFGYVHEDDAWYISESDFYINGNCHMDNFDMYTFLQEYLQIPREIIKWGE